MILLIVIKLSEMWKEQTEKNDLSSIIITIHFYYTFNRPTIEA